MMAKFYAAILAASTTLLSGAAHADRLPGSNTVLGQGLCNPSPFRSLKLCGNGVRNSELAQVPQFTIKGKNTSGTGDPLDLTYAQVLTALGLGTADSPTHAGLTISGVAVNFTGLGTGTLSDCAGFAAASNVLIRNNCPSTGGAQLGDNNAWTAGQAVTPTAGGTQSAGGTLTPNFALSNSVNATFGAGNLTIANPSNVKVGQSYIIVLTQDGTGGRTVTWGSQYKWQGGAAPTLSTAGGAKDLVSCFSDTTTTHNCVLAVKGAS